jgi:hypothetical protein
MVHRSRTRGRLLVVLGVFAALALGLSVPGDRLTAQLLSSGPSAVRIEEDWSLLVGQPAQEIAAPQVSTQMARDPWTSRFFNFHINSTDVPAFASGGLQLQAWKGSTNLAYLNSSTSPVLATSNELITWTQYLAQNSSGGLTFGISAASSQTFGDFSGMQVSISTSNTDLSDYSPDYSQQNSGVTFGANRVTSLTIVQVRTYYSDGSMTSDSTPRVVYSSASGN